MKIFALFFIALIVSFQAFAYESGNLSTAYDDKQVMLEGVSGQNQGNVQPVSWGQPVSANQDEDLQRAEKRDEFFLAVCIYSLIILVYSLYWHKNNKPVE